jgi:hypothetical protein
MWRGQRGPRVVETREDKLLRRSKKVDGHGNAQPVGKVCSNCLNMHSIQPKRESKSIGEPTLSLSPWHPNWQKSTWGFTTSNQSNHLERHLLGRQKYCNCRTSSDSCSRPWPPKDVVVLGDRESFAPPQLRNKQPVDIRTGGRRSVNTFKVNKS